MSGVRVGAPTARDVLADRITRWAGEANVYFYADRLLNDLDSAGFEVVPSGTRDKLDEALRLLLSSTTLRFHDPAVVRQVDEDRYALLHEEGLVPCDAENCDGGPNWRTKHGLLPADWPPVEGGPS